MGQKSIGEKSEHAHLQNRFVDSFFGKVPLLTGCSTIKGDMQNQSSETVLEGQDRRKFKMSIHG